MGVGIFSDCIFFLKVNNLPLKEKKKLKSIITSNGGEISFVLNEKCTHAVVSNPATLNSTQQKKIEKHVISVVNPDFIWKSVQKERLIEVECEVNDEPFEVTEDEYQEDKKNLFLEKYITINKKETLERNLEEDLEFEDSGEDDNIPDDTEVAKYCCFQKDKEYAVVELLCFNRQGPFPFRISTVCGLPNTSQKEFTFHLVDTAEKACEKYEHRVNDVINKGFTQINKIPLQAENLASKALQKVLLGEAINIRELSPEVAGLVESVWVDADGHLDSILSCPVENISLNDLSKAEGILRQVRNALIKKDKEEIHQMMQEFYRFIPHKEKKQNNINMKFLTVKQDLCQVIRDMINVCETSLSRYNSTSSAKYQALRCRIEYLDTNSAEFLQVKQGILDHNHSNRQFHILRVFRVGRLSEATNFRSDLGNVKSLLHSSSPCNFVGILSRGLMMPKIIVEDFGGERTDIGNLGSGIYFGDSISTSIKYSQPSDLTGSRLLVVCDVALGKCTDVFRRDYTITEPPSGSHSVHGVQRKDGVNSDFTDDEYVVYNVNQVQMRYIVQFSTDGDNVDLDKESLFISIDQTPDHCISLPEPSEDVSIEDLPDQQDIKGGLKGSDGQQIPLQSIHVKARLMDLAAQVVIFQTYKNNSTFPIEAKYVFPLDSTAAVCGFEAFINRKHIIGKVKEKQQAHREYRTAISEGHGAYLMDQDSPDVFTVSVGNLPPKATVVIKITYVLELNCQHGCITFSIPGSVAQWQQDNALKENTQDTVTKVGIESDMAPEGSFCLDMSIEMPRKIELISSYTHKIKIKKTECKAVIQTEESSSFNYEGFSVLLFLENVYIPRMWVEKHPDKNSEACMLIFQPDIEYTAEDIILTICLDCSNSMESCFHSAKQVALLALRSINCSYVNIVLFGSNYKQLYFCPKSYQWGNLVEEQFIKEAKPTMGSTEVWKVLQSLCLLRPKKGHQKVLLITDGHVQNENVVFQILNKYKNDIQLFTCGIGTTANKHMLRCFAQYGSGAFEYFADSSKSRWKDQMERQRTRLQYPACTEVSVKWRLFNPNCDILQAPTNIQALFPEDPLFCYGFVSNCTQATLKAVINNEELENIVSTTELQKTTGTILHTLTARALIKDYEDGILHEKENENEMKKQEMKSIIIDLSKEYSLVTQFTSFVAVEERSAEEDIDLEPNVLEIISSEDVDILPYMDWSSPDADEGHVLLGAAQETIFEEQDYDMELASLDMICPVTCSMERSTDADEYLPDTHQSFIFDEEDEENGELNGDVNSPLRNKPAPYAASARLQRKESSSPPVNNSQMPMAALGMSLFQDAIEDSICLEEEEPAASLLEPLEAEDDLVTLSSSIFRSRRKRRGLHKVCAVAEPRGRSLSPVERIGLAQERTAEIKSFLKIRDGNQFDHPQMPLAAAGERMVGFAASRSSTSSEDFWLAKEQLAQSSFQYSESAVAWSAPSEGQPGSGAGPSSSLFGSVIPPPPAPGGALFGSVIPPAPAPFGALFGSATQYSSNISSDFGSLKFGTTEKSMAYTPPPPPPPFPASRSLPLLQGAGLSSSLFGSVIPPPPAPCGALFGSATQYSSKISSDFESLKFGTTEKSMAYPPPPPPPPVTGSLPLLQGLGFSPFGSAIPPAPGGALFGSVIPPPPAPCGARFGSVIPPPPAPRGALFGSATQYSSSDFGSLKFGTTKKSMAYPPPPPPPPVMGSLPLLPGLGFSPFGSVIPPAPGGALFGSVIPPPPAPRGALFGSATQDNSISFSDFGSLKLAKKIKSMAFIPPPPPPPAPVFKAPRRQRRPSAPPSWSYLSSLQSQEGYWPLNQELGALLEINVSYLTEDFLVKKGITSLGARGIDTLHKLIATLLALQIIRTHNMLSGVQFKNLMKLDQSVPKSLLYPSIEKAIEWAVKADRQYPGICMRLGLGKDWDQVTRQLLGLDPISETSQLYAVSEFLFLS